MLNRTNLLGLSSVLLSGCLTYHVYKPKYKINVHPFFNNEDSHEGIIISLEIAKEPLLMERIKTEATMLNTNCLVYKGYEVIDYYNRPTQIFPPNTERIMKRIKPKTIHEQSYSEFLDQLETDMDLCDTMVLATEESKIGNSDQKWEHDVALTPIDRKYFKVLK